MHSLDWRWLTKPMRRGPRRVLDPAEVDLVEGESDDTAGAAVRGGRLTPTASARKLDITKWTFLNTDLAVHVFRVPDGEWIGIRAETSYGPDGIGTTIGTLFDEERRRRRHPAVGAGAAHAWTLISALVSQLSAKPLRGTA